MTAIWWLRRDLRLSDNAALTAAAAQEPVLPVFLDEPLLRAQGAASRWRLGRALAALDADLRTRFGSGIVLRTGAPEVVLSALAAEVGAAEVHALDWPEAGRLASDAATARALAATGRKLVLHEGVTLMPAGALQAGTGGAFKVYSAFARAARAQGVPPPASAPARLTLAQAPSEPWRDLAPDMRRGAAVLAAHGRAPGEAAARARLDAFLAGPVDSYAAARDRLDRDSSGLSCALATGEIGPRTIWASAADHPASGKFLSEVLWRDFAWHLLRDRPDLSVVNFRPDWDRFPWRSDNPDAEAWRRAVTDEPLVDAGLREMFVTGTMHNRVRMVVASYLTKHLLTDWRVGLAWFDDCLTDWDPASNAMNWQWVAGSGPDAAPYFRVFNPALQAEKFDPEGTYRRRWLAPASGYFDAVPRSWSLTPDYPLRPIIGLAEGRARALAALQG